MSRMSKGTRVKVKATGEQGIVTQVLNNCLWVKMDDGRNMSGAKHYYAPVPTPRKSKETV